MFPKLIFLKKIKKRDLLLLTHVIEIFFRNQPKILKLLLKMHIYASCEVWKFSPLKGWEFAVDEKKRGRVLVVELTSSFEYLRILAFDDFGDRKSVV